MARYWYSYNGIGDPLLSTSYNLMNVKPACINGARVCAIYATGGTFNPAAPLSARLRTYIANIQLALIPQPDSSLGVKKYVYGRVC